MRNGEIALPERAEKNEGVERLLKAERPRAAFWYIRLNPSSIDALVLFFRPAFGDGARWQRFSPAATWLSTYT
jgi:hypothetical protein